MSPPPSVLPAPAKPRRPFPETPREIPATAQGPELDLETLLRWAGIVLVLLASLFLVRTAIIRGWIGPELQLLGATMIGGGLLAAAFPLVERRRPWATTLATAGVAVLAVCAGAGYRWLELYGPSTGLVLVSAAVAVSVLAARRLDLEVVALAATAAMLVVPTWASIVTDAPEVQIGIWLGLFAVTANIVGLAWGWPTWRLVTTWAVAVWVSALAAGLAAEGVDRYALAGSALVALVGALLWFGPALVDRASDRITLGPRLRSAETWSSALVPLWAWGSVLGFAALEAEGPGGALGLGLAVALLALAWFTRSLVGRFGADALAAQFLGAGTLAAAASVVWLDGPALLPVGALLALVLMAIGVRFGTLVLAEGVVIGVMTAVAAAGGMLEVTAEGGTVGRHLAHLSVVVALALVAGVVRARGPRDVADPLLAATWVGALGWIGSALANAPQGQVAISGIWAVAGGAALVVGIRGGRAVVRSLGLATLAVVLVKLLTVDLATVDALWRVGLFLVVGLGLLRLGFVLPSLAPAGQPDAVPAPAGSPDAGTPQGEMGAFPGSVDNVDDGDWNQ